MRTGLAISAAALALVIACGGKESGGGGVTTWDASYIESGVRDASSDTAPQPADAGEEEAGMTAGPPPDTFINAAVGGGSACTKYPSLTEFLQIGTATAGHPDVVQNGGQDRNAKVGVMCTVRPQGNGFDIAVSASDLAPQGNSLSFSGTGVTTMPTSGILADFVGPSAVIFSERPGANDPGCTITYQYDPGGSIGGVAGDAPIPVSPPIAPGRIWGHIHCPNASSAAVGAAACDMDADFVFEQCMQQ